ncbi:DNA-directed RNA polymerase I subunit RPA43-like [Watersipora subatra]|uniref:DNA-directed RNA polymerase I subunit RPA43-like n=1 Tax=Watersipora subatra TaxID=2589382 RepID=UPI00355B326C
MLNAKLGKFDERLQCIPVSIRKTRRLGNTGIISGERPHIYFKVLTEFIAFQPVVAKQIAGTVQKLSPSHIGLLVHEWFNASVVRNAQTAKVGQVKCGDEVLLEVVRSVVNRSILSLECKLLKILKKMSVDQTRTESLTDEAVGDVTETTRKRKRTRSNTDSGIDPESNLDSSLPNHLFSQPPSKKLKENALSNGLADAQIKDHSLNAGEELTRSMGDETINNVLNPSAVKSQHINESQSLDLVDASPSKSPKKKKKKKHKSLDPDERPDISELSAVSLDLSMDNSEKKVVKKKKHKSRRSDLEAESESAADLSMSVGDNGLESSRSKKKSKHKRHSTLE